MHKQTGLVVVAVHPLSSCHRCTHDQPVTISIIIARPILCQVGRYTTTFVVKYTLPHLHFTCARFL